MDRHRLEEHKCQIVKNYIHHSKVLNFVQKLENLFWHYNGVNIKKKQDAEINLTQKERPKQWGERQGCRCGSQKNRALKIQLFGFYYFKLYFLKVYFHLTEFG